MTPTGSNCNDLEVLQRLKDFKSSVEADPLGDWADEGFEIFSTLDNFTEEPEWDWLHDYLKDWLTDNQGWKWINPAPMLKVGQQRAKTTEGYKKLNVSRSGAMGNPFAIGDEGIKSAEDATNAYIPWLDQQLRDTNSKEYIWFESTSELMHKGQRLELGCCGHENCHGHYIAHLLKTGDWRRWDTLDVSEWCDDVTNFLAANYRKFDAFEDGGSAYTKWEVLLGKVQFLDWDDDSLAKKRRYGLLYVLLVAHGPNGKHELIEGDADTLLRTVAAIKETGEFPKNDTQKQQSEVDQLIAGGASKIEILQSVAARGVTNSYSVERYAEEARREYEQQEDIIYAIDKLLDAGEVPEIHLDDYVPAKWLPGFRVLKEGLKFQDDVLVATILCCVGAMLPPTTRIHAKSMEEKVIVWLFLIGTSGVAKSVLIKLLCMTPMNFGVVPAVKVINGNESENYRRQKAEFHREKSKWDRLKAEEREGKNPPSQPEPTRKKNVIYTAPTTQGIRADLAEYGPILPSLLAKDELSSWFKEMASPGRQTDIEFYLSGYDGSYSNEVFAEARFSREVTEAALSVLGGTQPRVFLQYLEAGNANGFNARPLFFQVPRVARQLLDKLQDDHDLTIRLGDLYEAAFRLGPIEPLLAHSEGFADRESQPAPDLSRKPTFWLSEEATEQFVQVFNHLEEKSISAGSDEVEALWAKAPGQVLRWAAPLQFLRSYTEMEEHSDDWQPPDHLLPHGFWRNIRQQFNYDESKVEEHVRKFFTRVSTTTIKLATKLVIAGKTTGVDLVERGQDPMQEMLRVFLAYAKKHTPKASSKGVKLGTIRKNAWNAKARPSAPDIKQMAMLAKSRGLVVLVENGTAVRSVR